MAGSRLPREKLLTSTTDTVGVVMSVGDVLDLGRPKDSPVFLEIGGYQWFTGRMGTHKKNMAIKIDEVCYSAEQRSE